MDDHLMPTLPVGDELTAWLQTENAPIDPNGFAAYLVKYLTGREGYRSEVPPEARALAAQCDAMLVRDVLGFEIVCIVDRQTNPHRLFNLDAGHLERIGRACLKYSGKVGRPAMPVTIHLIEVGASPATANQKLWLGSYKRSSMFSKVHPHAWVFDVAARTVWTNAPFGGRFIGRRRFERLLREPRLSDAELQPDARIARRAGGHPVVAYLLIGILVAMFGLEIVLRIDGTVGVAFKPSIYTSYAMGGLYKPLVLEGQWYRLMSSVFLHLGVLHLLMNSAALYFAGRVLENLIGRWWFLAIFFVGGLSGALMSLALNSANIVSVGASGAIMALLAAACVCSFRMPIGTVRYRAQMNLIQVLVPSLIPLFPGQSGQHVDYAAHLGGALGGAAMGALIFWVWPSDQVLPRFRTLAAGVAIAGLLFALAAVWPLARQREVWVMGSHMIPVAQLPKNPAEWKARSATLVARFPEDPRGHMFRALALSEARNSLGAEAELKAALIAETQAHRLMAPDLNMVLHTLLAHALAANGKREEAEHEAALVCASKFATGRDELTKLGFCKAAEVL